MNKKRERPKTGTPSKQIKHECIIAQERIKHNGNGTNRTRTTGRAYVV